MPAPEARDRFQKALLWVADGFDGFGRPVVTGPTEINVRWKYVNSQMVGKDGVPIAIDATVVVNRLIPVGSVLILGKLQDWVGTGSNDTPQTVMEVKGYNETPDIRNRATRYTVSLAFYKGQLPELG